MANDPDDRPTSKRVTPKGGSEPSEPATKAAARKAAASAKVGDGDAPVKARPQARKIDPNRKVVAPKVDAAKVAARSGDPKKKAAAQAEASSRYTAPIPNAAKISPWWVPALMFGLLGLGMLIIFVNYLHWPFGDPSNVRLIAGLGCILGGILTATRYQ